MRQIIMGVLLVVWTAAMARADVVTLKSGDRVTGTLENIKDGNLQLKTEVLGTVTIPLAKIATFSAEKPVAVLIKGRAPIQGTLEINPSGDLEVTADGRTETIAAATVEIIMPADEYQKLTGEAPKPWQAWKGLASLGYSAQKGNQDTSTVAITVNAIREHAEPIFKPHLRTTYNLTTLLSRSSEGSSSLTSHTLSTMLREDVLFSPTNFVFGLAQLDHVSTQDLYLRQTYGGGFGHEFIKNATTNFSVLGGLTLVHEKFYMGAHDQTAALLVGETLGKQFSKRIRLDHGLNFYPNLSNTGEYRFDTTTVLSVKLRTRLALNASLIDLFLSDPPPGSHRNSLSVVLGIGYVF